ncbi:MAG TPA: TonB-dependent receptor, partial [Polyangiaceae bacterium]|nr:TonB-dependent receptor [Polyangiaceae bacterium]
MSDRSALLSPCGLRWGAAFVVTLLTSTAAHAQVVQAEPLVPIAPVVPAAASPREAQITLQLVIDTSGAVESALESSRLPADTPDAFVVAAVDAAKAVRFAPSTRDGRAIRSRIEYVVVFHAPPVGAPAPSSSVPVPPPAVPLPVPNAPIASIAPIAPAPRGEPKETVDVRGKAWASPRGLGDIRVDRETLTASPRQQTSEMLSAAPGFFVDHEDGEGLGNDVYLRGFDLDNGSGIEMKVGEVPINIPLHIHGQGYADANFIIPEVVRSIRVLEGPYDPRQGDSAIVGSALFDLGVAERGYELRTTYGSFNQARVVGIAAPEQANDETFAAFSLRETQGFGEDRAAKSASINAQYGTDLGDRDHLRVLATAYAATAALPGVVRQDDLNAGRIGYYDAYPTFNSYYPANCAPNNASCVQPAQGVSSARVILESELDHTLEGGGNVEVAPWLMWTNFLSRQNYTGSLNSSNLQPALNSLGDLWQLTNVETAGGITGRFHAPPMHFGKFVEVAVEPGVSIRVGHTEQGKDLVNPADLEPWDYRTRYGLDTLDLAG